jgi:branched-chain amino acid transport system substrate-binding protein
VSARARPDRRRLPGLVGLLGLACLVLLVWTWPTAAGEPGEFVLGAPTSLATREGADCLRAAALAVEEINAAGGVAVGERRLRLRLEPFDLNDVQPGQPPARAVARLAAFIEAKNPQAMVIGPFRSEVLLEAMDLLAAKRLPALMSIAMSPAVDAKVLGDPKYRHLFRVCLSTRYLAAYLIETMKLLRRDFGFTRVYVLNQDVAWARSTASLMLRVYFERAGWQVLGQENLAEGAEDFRPALARIKEQGAQVILGIFDMPASAGLVRQWHEMKPPALLCGFVSPATGPEAWPLLGEGLVGLTNVIFEMGNLPSRRYAPAAEFSRAFQARYGRPVQAGHGPAPAYESVHVLAEAMARAGSLDPDRLAEALERTDRRGVMGRLRFHRGHQAVFGDDPKEEALACVVQWNAQGQRVIVHPQSVAEGRLFLPSFVKPAE